VSTGTSVPRPRASGPDLSDSALLDTLLREAPIGFAFFGSDLRFRRVNQALAGLAGLDPAGHVGRMPAEVWPADLAADQAKGVGRLLDCDP
jgi:PAS domain-containing protein